MTKRLSFCKQHVIKNVQDVIISFMLNKNTIFMKTIHEKNSTLHKKNSNFKLRYINANCTT